MDTESAKLIAEALKSGLHEIGDDIGWGLIIAAILRAMFNK